MRYTIQLWTESGNYAAPLGTDVKHVSSKAHIKRRLQNWMDEVSRYEHDPVCGALVWKGHHEDVTDLYPDAEATLGKRGGLNLI